MVANVKPLNLKRQRATSAARRTTEIKSGDLQAEVVLDLGIFHVEQSFTYAVPEHLEETLSIGSLVQVPFRNARHTGVVVSVDSRSKGNLFNIESIRASNVFSPEQLHFFEKIAERYLCNFAQMLLKAVPTLNKSTQMHGIPFRDQRERAKLNRRLFIPIGLADDPNAVMIRYLSKEQKAGGSTLLLFPTLKALQAFREAFLTHQDMNHVEVGSHLTPALRRSSFQRILGHENLIILGLRGGVLAPIRDLARIYVLDESSAHYVEQRAPYWNLRDVALLRSDSEGCDLLFFGHGCSAELQRLIDLNWVKLVSKSGTSVLTKSIQTLPSNYFELIRRALKKGPVLVCTANKDYAPGFVCKNCRNRARCKCGGLLSMQDKGSVVCSICDWSLKDWRCVECQGVQYLIYRSGAKRIVEEVGKAFPGQRVILTSPDDEARQEIGETCIVISSYSNIVKAKQGFAGIVLLDGEEMASRQFIRAEEELFNLWLNALSLARSDAEIYLSLNNSNPVSQAIIARKPARFMQHLNRDRQETNLPPFVRVIQIDGEIRALSGLRIKFENEYGAIAKTLISHSGTRLTVKVKQESAAKVLHGLKALQKLRSSGGKELFTIKVDPYYL